MTYTYRAPKPDTLGQALEGLSDDQYIGIGASSGFIFFGTKSEYRYHKDTWERYYKMRAKQIAWNRGKNAPLFKPFSQRKVKDIFYRHTYDEPKMLVIIVEGREIGLSWFVSEYKAARERAKRALRKE